MSAGGASACRALLLAAFVGFASMAIGAGAAAGGPATASADVDSAKLDEVADYLEAQREALGIPGLAAGVVLGEEVVFLEGFGESGSGEPVDPDTPFMIASLSKSLTAIAVMQLVEDGSLGLDDPVSDHLPELSPPGDAVSVRDLLHHRSGLSTYAGRDPIDGADGASLKANVSRLGPLLEPDSPYRYSNANYDALALIVERVSGVPLSDYMHARVFGPLQMDRSFLDPSRAADARLAQGHYRWLFAGYRSHDARMPPGMAGSATMFSSAEDLTHVLMAQLNAGTVGDTQVLSPASIDELHSPTPYEPGATGGYAMGWHVLQTNAGNGLSDVTMLAHDGFWATYGGAMWMVPEAELGFVILANGSDISHDTLMAQVGRGVRAILFDLDPPPVTSGSSVLQRFGKHLLLAVVVGQVLLAAWTAPMLARLRRSRRLDRRAWTTLIIATVLDVTAIVLLVWVVPAAAEAPLAVPFGYPDFRILFIAMGTGVAWGMIRTALVGTALLRPVAASGGEGRPLLD